MVLSRHRPLNSLGRTAVFGEYSAISDAPGVYGGAWLQPVDTATTLRLEEREAITTDGPFAETKEILGGVFVVDLPDLDEAIRIASLIPTAKHGSVEIRPILA